MDVRTRDRWTSLAAVLVTSSLAACGSGGGLGRSKLAAKADAVCADTQRAAHAIPATPTLQDPHAAAAYFDKLGPITAKETSALQALKPDQATAKDWSAFIAAQRSANQVLQTLKAKADANDAAGLQAALVTVLSSGQRVRTTAQKLNLKVCSQ